MDTTTGGHSRVTRILDGSRGMSRAQVLELLAPVVYEELRVLAGAQLRREGDGHSLQATALVNEACVRLLGDERAAWNDRGHFFRAAALAMRRILIDHARRRARPRHGADLRRVTLGDAGPASWDEPERLMVLDEGLRRLEERDPRAAEVVQLRYFAGLSIAETAEALEVSEQTVKRDWTFAKAWLRQALR